MKLMLTLLLIALLFSCTDQKKQTQEEFLPEKKSTKLEQLMLLPKDSIIKYYDLSNDSIKVFPNLSSYTIKSLNLSNNQIDTFLVEYLPKELLSIDLSHNLFKGDFTFQLSGQDSLSFKERQQQYDQATIRKINISYNTLTRIFRSFPLRKNGVSHNDVTYINFDHRNIEYLDISHNPNLSNVLAIEPEEVDTIIREGIANDKKLVPSNRVPDLNDYH